MAQMRSTQAMNQRGKPKISNLQYGLRKQMCVWRVWEWFLYTGYCWEFLTHLESKTSRFEIVVQWLVSCYQVLIYNFEVKESCKFLLKLRKLRTLGNESQNILATKTALNFSRLYSRIHPLKWSNTAGALTERYIEDITRWREDMNFMFEWQEQYLTSERSERVKNCSCHENIKFISSS